MGILKIYSASAGSGKTFRLAKSYIDLLFLSPAAYKHILAVTFTNKAASEMKRRILDKLHQMATDDNEKDYTPDLMSKTGLTREAIKAKSGKILEDLLHHYSKFSIQTIDSFFQNVIRSFIRELGLPFNYALEMNQQRMLNETVDLFLHSAGDQPEVRTWLVQFAESKIREGKNWNFKSNMLDLGSEFFNERGKTFFYSVAKQIKDRNFLKQYKGELERITNHFEKQMRLFGLEGQQLIEKHNFKADDFTRKSSGVGAYFFKLTDTPQLKPNSYVLAAAEDPEAWFPKNSPLRSGSEQIIIEEFQPLLIKVMDFYRQHIRFYFTAKQILRQYYNLGIATELAEKLLEHSKEQNAFLMADMAYFLSRITQNNDAPFIYEKTGSFYHHFMLDEFQDTSELQWENFRPLITNSLSQGNFNLLVGDTKQSIYRWRNSNWKIMEEKVEKQFSTFDPVWESLPKNFRSRETIVSFNNAFFAEAPARLQDWFNESFEPGWFDPAIAEAMQNKIRTIYQNQHQQIARPTHPEGGYLHIGFPDQNPIWHEAAGQAFTDEIVNLLHQGISPGSIALLVRKSEDGQRAIRELLDLKERVDGLPDYTVISADSLSLKNASSVRFLVAFLKFLDDPSDQLNLTHLFLEFRTLRDQPLHFESRTNNLASWFEETLFSDIADWELKSLVNLSLTEIIQELIRIYDLGKNENEIPFIHAFLNVVLDFTKEKTGGIRSFLEWWQEEGENENLQMGDNEMAIRVLTIHKAKGLEFEYVFIPYANWPTTPSNHNPILWCPLQEAPFNTLSPIPVKFVSDLKDSLFAPWYLEEVLDTCIDNLNLLYVACTRAISGLYIFAPPDDSLNKISGLLYQTLHQMTRLNTSPGHWEVEDQVWVAGSLPVDEASAIKQQSSLLTLKKYYGWSVPSNIKLKFRGIDFFSGDVREKVKRGTLLHEIFENIITIDDIDSALLKVHEMGKISRAEKAELKEHILQLITKPGIAEWFSGSWKVKTEAEFLIPKGGTLRPDRVMVKDNAMQIVDYKFGEIKSPHYRYQVLQYKNNLEKMGFKQVRAWLWYVEKGEVEEVA